MFIAMLTGCSGFKAGVGPGSDQLSSNNKFDVSFEQYQKVVEKNCNHCHGGPDSLYPTIVNFRNFQDEASWLAQTDLIVAGDRSQSSMYYRLTFAKGKVASTNNNMPFPAPDYPVTMTDAEAELIGNFIDSRGVSPGINSIVDKSSAESALTKAKFIVNGGAVTANELSMAAASSQLNRAALKQLSLQWMETAEGREKLIDFLKLTLSQDGWEYPDMGTRLFGEIGQNNPNREAWQRNLEESMARTALAIIESGQPFTNIVNSRQRMVTSALLSSLSFADTQNIQENSNAFDNHLETLNNGDFTDWRMVTLASGNNVTAFDNMNAIRNTNANANYQLRLPRVGFFNTLAFQLKFPTNDGNDYRVTASEMLIVATNQIFEAGDQSANGPDLSAVDQVHAQPNTSCYQCHRLMDPIRETFRTTYDHFYKLDQQQDVRSTYFSFRDHQGPNGTVDQLAQTVSAHPLFAHGWAAKFCAYANSEPCDENSAEFVRIVDVFKSSNMNFKMLAAEMLASPIVTAKGGGEADATTFMTAGLISATRGNHFCHALTTRYQQVLNAAGSNANARDLCDLNNATRSFATALGSDSTVRGSAGLSQSPDSSPFGVQSLEQLCSTVAGTVVGAGFSTNDGNVSRSLDHMAQYIMGLATNHPRYTASRAALQRVYDYGQNNHNLNNAQALEQAFTFACSSPDIASMGF